MIYDIESYIQFLTPWYISFYRSCVSRTICYFSVDSVECRSTRPSAMRIELFRCVLNAAGIAAITGIIIIRIRGRISSRACPRWSQHQCESDKFQYFFAWLNYPLWTKWVFGAIKCGLSWRMVSFKSARRHNVHVRFNTSREYTQVVYESGIYSYWTTLDRHSDASSPNH